MQKYVGVFRNTSDLKKALAEILSIKGQHKKISLSSRSLLWNTELQKYLELENLIISAESAVASALWRKESRGAHLVEEFPERNDKEFLCHTIYRFEKQECIARSVRKPSNPVHFFQPEKRIY
jgi:succinate dehydrogenase / fumarate reductase flavoprotein subunit